MARETSHAIEQRIVIGTTAVRALGAFFDASDLASWWHATRSVTVPAPLGPFAIQWTPTDFADEVLGRLGGTLAFGDDKGLVPGEKAEAKKDETKSSAETKKDGKADAKKDGKVEPAKAEAKPEEAAEEKPPGSSKGPGSFRLRQVSKVPQQ